MPTDLDEVSTGSIELLFPSDMNSGQRFTLREYATYEAEEVREKVGTDYPEFGQWVPVIYDDQDAWLGTVSELVQELQSYENPENVTFEVTKWRKTGTDQTASYAVNLENVDGDVKQGSL